MQWKRLLELGLALADVTEGTSWGTAALLVHGHAMVRMKEDGTTLVVWVEDLDEKEMLLETQPDLYFTTDHYNGYPAVLVLLEKLPVKEAKLRLARAHSLMAALLPKKIRPARKRRP